MQLLAHFLIEISSVDIHMVRVAVFVRVLIHDFLKLHSKLDHCPSFCIRFGIRRTSLLFLVNLYRVTALCWFFLRVSVIVCRHFCRVKLCLCVALLCIHFKSADVHCDRTYVPLLKSLCKSDLLKGNLSS